MLTPLYLRKITKLYVRDVSDNKKIEKRMHGKVDDTVIEEKLRLPNEELFEEYRPDKTAYLYP